MKHLTTFMLLISCATIAMAAPKIIVGGSFTVATNGAGGSPPLIGNRLVQYSVSSDAFSRYRNMGNDFNNDIRSIVQTPNGNTYVAGFYNAEGTNSNLRYLTYVNSSNPGWNPTYQAPSSIYSAISANDGSNNVIVAGQFFNAGGDSLADYIALWDGSRFTNIGGGFNSRIETMAWLGNDNLFVGGSFTNGPFNSPRYVARWTRSTNQWNRLGTNQLTSSVFAIHVVSATEIYIGGQFVFSGDGTKQYIIRYNNQTDSYHNLGGCRPVSSTVWAIETAGSDVFVGGQFTSIEDNSITAYRVARFDKNKQQWFPLVDANGNTAGVSSTVYDLKLNGNWLAIGGSFSTLTPSNADARYVAFYNTQTHAWKYPQNSYRLSSTVFTIVWLDADNVLLGGDFTTTTTPDAYERLASISSDTFSTVDSISRNSDVECFAAIDANTHVVGGDFNSLPSQLDYLYKRTAKGAEPLFAGQAFNSGVYALHYESAQKMLWIGGGFSAAGCHNCRYVFGFNMDTKETHTLPYGAVQGTVYALSVSTNSNGDRILNIGHSSGNTYQMSNSGYYTRYNINQRKMEIITGSVATTARALQTDVQDSKNVWIGFETNYIGRFYNAYVVGYNLNKDSFDRISPSTTWFNSIPYTAIDYDGKIWFGGPMSNINGMPYNDYLATYDPNTKAWFKPPYDKDNTYLQASSFQNIVYDMQTYNGKLYVVGSTFNAGNNGANDYTVVWDPATKDWSRFCSGIPSGNINTFSIIDGIGYFGTSSGNRFYTCNISTNAVTTAPALSSHPLGFAKDPNDASIIWVSGSFINAGGDNNADYLIKYNTTTNTYITPFSGTDIPNNAVTNVLSINGWIFAAGHFTNLANDNNLDYIAKWNGTHWHHLTNQVSPNNVLGDTGYSKSGMTYIGNNRLIICGSFTSAGGNANRDYVAEIDVVNRNYTNRFMAGNPTYQRGPSTVVRKVMYTPASNRIWMVTTSSSFYVGDQTSNYLAKFDGTQNKLVPVTSSTLNNRVYALAQKANILYVGGSFSTYNDHLVKYDTQADTWSRLPSASTSTNNDVRALYIDGNDLWIGGGFTTLFSVSGVNRIGRWNGTHVNKIGQGVNGWVYAINKVEIPALSAAASSAASQYQRNCSAIDTVAAAFCASTLGGNYMTASDIGQNDADKQAKQAAMAAAAGCDACSKAAKQLFCHKFFPKCASSSTVQITTPCQAECDNYATACGVTPADVCSTYPTTQCTSGIVDSASACQVGSSVFADSPRHLYAAGSFYRTDGRRIRYMTCMNKQTGDWFTAPRCTINNNVRTMTPDGTGNGFYLGGDFSSGSSLTNLNRIGHYNYVTDTYTALSNGLGSTVYKMEKRGDTIWIAGSFTNAPNGAGHRFIKYNITSETYSSGYMTTAPSSTVRDFAFSGDNKYVYLIGDFSNMGSNVGDYFVQLDLQNGTYTPTVWNLGSSVNTIAKVPNQDLFYVGGSFTTYNGFQADRLIRFDPTTKKFIPWSADYNINNQVWGLGFSKGNMFVGGEFTGVSTVTNDNYFIKFSTSTGMPSEVSSAGQVNNRVYAVTTDGNDGVFFGGRVTSLPNAGGSNYVALYNTTTNEYVSLSSQRTLNSYVWALLWDNGVLYAGGQFTGRISRWTKKTNTWTTIGGGVGSTVYSLEKHGNNLYLGGSFTTSFDSDASALVRLPKEGRWRSLTTQVNSFGTEGTNYGTFLAEVDNELYIGGNMYQVYGGSNTFYANKVFKLRRDNGEPQSLGGGVFGGSVSGMTGHQGNLVVTGSFTAVDGIDEKGAYFAFWSGANNMWTAPRKDSSVKLTGATYQTLLINELYLGCVSSGCFEKTVGNTVTKYSMARYHMLTGTWTMVGSPVTDEAPMEVYTIARVKDTFYIATDQGLRTLPVGSITSNFKKVGCFSDGVYTLLPYKNGLFVGGNFGNAGIKDSNDLIFYNHETSSVERILDTKDQITAVYSMILHKGLIYMRTSGNFKVVNPDTLRFEENIGLETGNIASMIEFGGELVAVGSSHIGGLRTRYMSCVNVVTGQYENMENGTDSTVYALAKLGNYLYLGGGFNKAGYAYQSPKFARFNLNTKRFENAYIPVKPGSGLTGTVRVLKVHNGKIYVGGQFGEDQYNGISRAVTVYDPSTEQFSPLAPSQYLDTSVYALEFDGDGKLWIGGSFSGTEGQDYHQRILEYQPSGRVVKNLGSGVNGAVNKIAVDPADANMLYVGGSFTRAGKVQAYYIATYNRATSTWAPLGDPKALSSTVRNIHITTNAIIATGDFVTVVGRKALSGVAKYDRTAKMWAPLSSSQPDLPSSVYSIVDLPNAYCVGGGFSTSGGKILGRVAKRNESEPSKWIRLESHHTGPSGTVDVLGASVDGLAAGGSFSDADNQPNTARLAFYNGTAWGSTADTSAIWFSSDVEALASYNEGVLVGGSFSSVAGFATRLLKMGADFTVTSFPCGAVSSTVRAIAINGTSDLYIAGSFSNIDGTVLAKGVARYDIASGEWTMLGGEAFSTTVYSLLIKGKYLYVGGSQSGVGQTTSQRLALYNKMTNKYEAVPNVLSSTVEVIMPGAASGDLYIGGHFTNVDGNNDVDYIVRYNTNTKKFYPMNTDSSGRYPSQVYAMDIYKKTGDLYVLGSSYLRRWTGTAFVSLPNTYNCGTGYAMKIVGDQIFYGSGCGRRMYRYNITSQTNDDLVNYNFNSNVYTIVEFKPGMLFIGGAFTSPGRYAVIYDVNNDHFVTAPAYFNSHVRGAHHKGDYVYIGGYFSDVGNSGNGFSTNWDRYVVRMNINTYAVERVFTGVNSIVFDISSDNDYVYIAGQMSNAYQGGFSGSSYGMLRYNLTNGVIEPAASGVDSTVYSVKPIPGTNYIAVGGAFTQTNPRSAGFQGFTRFNRFTDKFEAVGNQNGPTTVYDMLDAGDRIHVVGTFTNAYGDNTMDYTFAWNTVTDSAESLGNLQGGSGKSIIKHNGKVYAGHNSGISRMSDTGTSYELENTELSGTVNNLKSYVDCQPYPLSSGFCKGIVTWSVGVNSALDWTGMDSKAESRYNAIKGNGSEICAQYGKLYACASVFPTCHHEYSAMPMCRSTCQAANLTCNGTVTSCSGLPTSGCWPNTKIPDYKRPIEPRALTPGEIAAIVIGSIIFVGAVTAGVLYYKHPPFRNWVDIKRADLKQWWAESGPGASKVGPEGVTGK